MRDARALVVNTTHKRGGYHIPGQCIFKVLVFLLSDDQRTWFKVPSKNTKSESGAERLGLVSMHAGEVSGAVLNLSGTLSSL